MAQIHVFLTLRRTLLLAGAIAAAAAALLLPADVLDARRTAHVEALQRHAAAEAARITPEDDAYVDYINTPYPLSSGALFRAILLADVFLAAGLALLPWRRRATAAPNKSTRRMDTADWTAALSLTALAAVLRCIGSGRDLWLDEITTLIRHARGPAVDIFLQATSSNNHLLNSLLAHISITLFGEKEWALRLPAILFGTASIPVFYALVRRFSPRWETILAAATLTLSYHHIFFSQDARGYTGMLFGALAGTLALLEALETDSPSAWLAYALSMIVCVVSVSLGAVVLASQFIAVMLWRRSWSFLWTFLATGWAILHAYAFVIPDMIGFLTGEYRRAEVGWKFSSELLAVILQGLRLGIVTTPVLLVGGLIFALGVISFWRQDRFLTTLLLLPGLLIAAAVVLLNAGVFPRFFLPILPAAVALVARGTRLAADALPARPARWAPAAAFVCMAVVSLAMLRTWWLYPKQDYRGARQWVESQLRPGDAVLTMGIVGVGYQHYWPEATTVKRVTDLRRIIAEKPRVWMLYGFPRDMEKRRPRLMDLVQREFREVAIFRGMVGDGDVRVAIHPPGVPLTAPPPSQSAGPTSPARAVLSPPNPPRPAPETASQRQTAPAQ